MLIQAGFALKANSMSLLADAGHNLGDVLGLLFAFGANYLLTQGASDRFSYGHKKTTIMAALCNALLLVATSLFIIQQSISHLLTLEHVHEQTVIIIALLGILINGGTALLFMSGRHADLNIRAAFWHLGGDTLISAGVVLTASIIYFTQWEWLDPAAALGIVIFILMATWGLLRDAVNLLLDAVPRNINQNAVLLFLESLPNVDQVHDFHIWGLSTHEVALTAHLVMQDDVLSDEQLKTINEALLHEFGIKHVTLQVERGHVDDVCGQMHSC